MKLIFIIGDRVCIFLGCYSPMILRPDEFGKFQVVGEACPRARRRYRSPWPPPLALEGSHHVDALGRPLHRYLNLTTYALTAEDPRLDDLPPEWERVAYERSPDDRHCLMSSRIVSLGRESTRTRDYLQRLFEHAE